MPESTLEVRIAGLEGSYRELTKRMDDLRSDLHRGLDGLMAEAERTRSEFEDEFSAVRGEMADLRIEGRANFRWIMSLILINWLSLLAAIFLVVGRR